MKAEDAIDMMKRMRIAFVNTTVDGKRVMEPIGMAIEALDKQIPKMLTIDELKQMHGKPVYLQFGDEPEGVWGICDIFKDAFTFYSLLGESNPDTDLYDLKCNDPDGYFGLHVLGWRAWSGEVEE